MFKECLGYCRDSKREWENIYSVEQQREAIEKYALENNLHIFEIFEDVNKYGKKFNREGLCGMLKYISLNPNVKCILVSDVSRLFIKFNSSWFTLKRFLEEHDIKLVSLVNVMNKYINTKK